MNVLLAGQYSGCGVGACTLMLHEPTPACIQVLESMPYLREVELLLLRAHAGLCSTTTVGRVSPIRWTEDELYLHSRCLCASGRPGEGVAGGHHGTYWRGSRR